MNAHLEDTFKRGFFLTEESLIKLDDIIRKRIEAADPSAKIQFKTFRADGMLVEFDNASAVAAEENSQRNAVRRIEILSSIEKCKLSLKFDAKEDTSIEIEATERDLAYLLSSDIKDYVQSEILKFRSFTFESALNSKFIFPLLIFPMMFLTFSTIKEAPSAEVVSSVIASNDLHAKLNFLIEARMSQDPRPFKWLLVACTAFLAGLFFLGNFLDRTYPRNIFYWGKQARSYDRLLRNRERIVWGIIIAFLIGIASTVAVDYFKKNRDIQSPDQTSMSNLETPATLAGALS